jgi:hypothetical protein
VSAQALLCSSCGAGLEPKVLETRVKCTYCATTFVILRDHDGIRGVAADGAAAPPGASTAPGATPAGAGAATGATGSPFDPQTIARLERDAVLVVRGLEAVEETAYAARGLARVGSCGCLGVVFLALSIAGVVAAVV